VLARAEARAGDTSNRASLETRGPNRLAAARPGPADLPAPPGR
jgi:hypothetical protein